MRDKSSPAPLDACCVVACGTLSREVRRLVQEGFLSENRIFLTAPGLHEWPQRFEQQVRRQVERARSIAKNVIVVYGETCYMNLDTAADTDRLLDTLGDRVSRVQAKHCVDVLADAAERERIADGAKVYWLTSGWLDHWDYIFKAWDRAKANETFPAHDKAIVLDAVGAFDEMVMSDPEKVLRISDWTKLDLEKWDTSLDRMRRLLADCAGLLVGRRSAEPG